MKHKSLCLFSLLFISHILIGCRAYDESAVSTVFVEKQAFTTPEIPKVEEQSLVFENPEVSEDIPSISENQEIDFEEKELDITLAFAGDLSLADNYLVMEYYRKEGKENIANCIDPAYIKLMTDADIMWINNEFCYSNQGSPMSGKQYTFRANPENVSILKELGVDIVGLANNHVYDFGEQAFLDTLATLKNAGITYVGAGATIDEASAPVYVALDGYRIAYVCATRAEKNIKTPQATESSGGVFRCYDNTAFIEKIKQAKSNADFVIALPHWGTEYSTTLEQEQIDGARAYIDAGADAVIGSHTHCLQGIDFYENKPILYSLGNFWFNDYSLKTMLLQLHITGHPNQVQVSVEIIPGTQSECVTRVSSTIEERNGIYKYLERISTNISISRATEHGNGGIVTPRQ